VGCGVWKLIDVLAGMVMLRRFGLVTNCRSWEVSMLRQITESEIESYKNLIRILEDKNEGLRRELDASQQSYEGQKANTLAFYDDVERLTGTINRIRDLVIPYADYAHKDPYPELLAKMDLSKTILEILDEGSEDGK
jgi:hypothetical protein